MNMKNYVRFEFQSLPENVSFARACVGAFAAQIDCTLEEIEEIKLVVSEAVSNCIIHGYENRPHEKVVVVAAIINDQTMEIMVEDFGKGIADIKQAMEPSFSSDTARMGLGFSLMKSFMDEIEVISQPGQGTSVKLKRCFQANTKEALA
ncbi:MAG: anti-sigma F factor [Syntrophomonas sp.]|nr:anti-sigma F factor [Syntrophomonas sp.]